jgi:hypothetical protein
VLPASANLVTVADDGLSMMSSRIVVSELLSAARPSGGGAGFALASEASGQREHS